MTLNCAPDERPTKICKNGHELSPENSLFSRGWRTCRLCHQASVARYKAKRVERAIAGLIPTLACRVCSSNFAPQSQRQQFCSRSCAFKDHGWRGRQADTFRARTEPDLNTGCWLWSGSWAPRAGYGRLKVGGREVRAHRYSWTLYRGPIPVGLVICHRCDTPACVNPDHLFCDTLAGNTADRDAKLRTARGERSGMAKLTAGQASEIYSSWRAGQSAASLAASFGVSPSLIRQIGQGKLWTHVTRGASA